MYNKKPGILITAILTLITIVFWAGFEVYHSLTDKPLPPVPTEIINPLDPTLDTKSLDSVAARTFLTDDQIGNTLVATPTALPSATPLSTPIATSTPSASVTPSPSSTP